MVEQAELEFLETHSSVSILIQFVEQVFQLLRKGQRTSAWRPRLPAAACSPRPPAPAPALLPASPGGAACLSSSSSGCLSCRIPLDSGS